jgi:hypothetical protein
MFKSRPRVQRKLQLSTQWKLRSALAVSTYIPLGQYCRPNGKACNDERARRRDASRTTQGKPDINAIARVIRLKAYIFSVYEDVTTPYEKGTATEQPYNSDGEALKPLGKASLSKPSSGNRTRKAALNSRAATASVTRLGHMDLPKPPCGVTQIRRSPASWRSVARIALLRSVDKVYLLAFLTQLPLPFYEESAPCRLLLSAAADEAPMPTALPRIRLCPPLM